MALSSQCHLELCLVADIVPEGVESRSADPEEVANREMCWALPVVEWSRNWFWYLRRLQLFPWCGLYVVVVVFLLRRSDVDAWSAVALDCVLIVRT